MPPVPQQGAPPARRRGSGQLRLGEWLVRWLDARANRVAPKTIANERSHARLYLGPLLDTPLVELTPGAVEDWLAWVERAGRQAQPPVGRPHTVRICHSLLSSILRDAVKHDLLERSPMARVARPKVPPAKPKYLELDDVHRVVHAAGATGDPRALAVLLMVNLGLRRNEALGLMWSDVDVDARCIRLRYQLGRDASVSGSELVRRPLKTTSSARDLHYSGDLATQLHARLEDRRVATRPDDFVVSLGEGRPVDPDALSHWLAALGAGLGIKVTPHRLRHSAATMMLNQGVPIETVGKVLGHGNVRTTSIYARVLDRSSDAALEGLAELLQVDDS